MTTTTNSHKAWTDKGGHVTLIEMRMNQTYSTDRRRSGQWVAMHEDELGTGGDTPTLATSHPIVS